MTGAKKRAVLGAIAVCILVVCAILAAAAIVVYLAVGPEGPREQDHGTHEWCAHSQIDPVGFWSRPDAIGTGSVVGQDASARNVSSLMVLHGAAIDASGHVFLRSGSRIVVGAGHDLIAMDPSLGPSGSWRTALPAPASSVPLSLGPTTVVVAMSDATLGAWRPGVAEPTWLGDLPDTAVGHGTCFGGLFYPLRGVGLAHIRWQDGTLESAWRTSLNGSNSSFVAHHNGALLVATEEGAVLSARRTGQIVWNISLDTPLVLPPVFHHAATIVATRNGQMMSLSDDGGVEWIAEMDAAITRIGYSGSGVALASLEGAAIVALDEARGQIAWQQPAADAHVSTIVGLPEFAVTVHENGHIRAYRLADGHEMWRTDLEAEVTGTALWSSGRLFVPTAGGLYSVDAGYSDRQASAGVEAERDTPLPSPSLVTWMVAGLVAGYRRRARS